LIFGSENISSGNSAAPESFVTFQHGEQHGDQILLEVEELLQEVDLARVPRQLFLHVGKQEEETADSVPEPGRVRFYKTPFSQGSLVLFD
jgi:hypothetical protein